MLKKKLLVVALASAFSLPALADDLTVSSNVSLVSDYLYRGISQTGTNPAIQGGFDLSHASGLYAGVWGSSISTLGDAGITASGTEIDTYAGFKGAAADVGYDVGFLRYNYPGTYGTATKADTNELYGAVSYSIVSAKLSYALGDTFGVSKAKGTTYLELNASYPIADTGIAVGAHYGKQTFKGATADGLADSPSYSDYKLNVTKDFSGYVVGLAFSSTDATPFYTNLQGKKLGKGVAVLSLSRAM
ncbi:MAG: hypothetical protein HOO97_09940 [Sideroxydans sp.]|nr:hypothetical protein [Sideroxydans sp.]NOT99394.1 hypothetical protein [Sideroxydans sp.]